jgi:hypothetical protein
MAFGEQDGTPPFDELVRRAKQAKKPLLLEFIGTW